jgi:signal transduction histidine kinase
VADLHEQLRLATAVRRVLRAVSADISTEHLLSACDDAMASVFGANGLWIRTFTTPHHPGAERMWTSASAPRLETWMRDLAESRAREAWQDAATIVYRVGQASLEIPDERLRGRLDNLLRSLGIASLMYVPLGVGAVCVGGLAMSRGLESAPWTPDEVETARELGHDLGQVILNAQRFEREQQLVADLWASDVSKTWMVRTLSHELKNPITAIAAHAELLTEADTHEARERSVAAIERNVHRLNDSVNGLMTLARDVEPAESPATSDLVSAVESIVDMVSATAKGASVGLLANTPPPPLTVQLAPHDLDHLVANLVSNAVKYTPSGGTVQVTVLNLGTEAVLEVADTGLGISPEDQAKLYDEFFRSTNPEALAQPGTGLGLAIVSRIVARNRGRIELTSAVGEGSTFRVTLPAS